jgi:hypothetical protein
MFYPSTQADAMLLKWWDEDSTTLVANGITWTVTTSTDNTVTATTSAFPNTWLDGNVVKCVYDNAATNTKLYGLIKTAGNDTRFVTHLAPFTNEVASKGDWACYPTYTALRLIQPKDTNEYSMWVPFPGPNGFKFPNLAIDSLSASCTAVIYLA